VLCVVPNLKLMPSFATPLQLRRQSGKKVTSHKFQLMNLKL